MVGAHVLVSRGLLPAMPVGECGLSDYKIQIKKKKKNHEHALNNEETKDSNTRTLHS